MTTALSGQGSPSPRSSKSHMPIPTPYRPTPKQTSSPSPPLPTFHAAPRSTTPSPQFINVKENGNGNTYGAGRTSAMPMPMPMPMPIVTPQRSRDSSTPSPPLPVFHTDMAAIPISTFLSREPEAETKSNENNHDNDAEANIIKKKNNENGSRILVKPTPIAVPSTSIAHFITSTSTTTSTSTSTSSSPSLQTPPKAAAQGSAFISTSPPTTSPIIDRTSSHPYTITPPPTRYDNNLPHTMSSLEIPPTTRTRASSNGTPPTGTAPASPRIRIPLHPTKLNTKHATLPVAIGRSAPSSPTHQERTLSQRPSLGRSVSHHSNMGDHAASSAALTTIHGAPTSAVAVAMACVTTTPGIHQPGHGSPTNYKMPLTYLPPPTIRSSLSRSASLERERISSAPNTPKDSARRLAMITSNHSASSSALHLLDNISADTSPHSSSHSTPHITPRQHTYEDEHDTLHQRIHDEEHDDTDDPIENMSSIEGMYLYQQIYGTSRIDSPTRHHHHHHHDGESIRHHRPLSFFQSQELIFVTYANIHDDDDIYHVASSNSDVLVIPTITATTSHPLTHSVSHGTSLSLSSSPISRTSTQPSLTRKESMDAFLLTMQQQSLTSSTSTFSATNNIINSISTMTHTTPLHLTTRPRHGFSIHAQTFVHPQPESSPYYSVRVFSVTTLSFIQTLRGHDGPIIAIYRDTWCQSSDYVIVQTDKQTLYVWCQSVGTLEMIIPASGAAAFLTKRHLFPLTLNTSLSTLQLDASTFTTGEPSPTSPTSPDTSSHSLVDPSDLIQSKGISKSRSKQELNEHMKEMKKRKKQVMEDDETSLIVYVYENQRHYPLKGWSRHLLPTDRPHLSNEDGTRAVKPMDQYTLPPGWTWTMDWTVLVDPALTDEQGWSYASDFRKIYKGHAKKKLLHNVRRRCWYRKRQPISKPNSTPTSAVSSPPAPTATGAGLMSASSITSSHGATAVRQSQSHTPSIFGSGLHGSMSLSHLPDFAPRTIPGHVTTPSLLTPPLNIGLNNSETHSHAPSSGHSPTHTAQADSHSPSTASRSTLSLPTSASSSALNSANSSRVHSRKPSLQMPSSQNNNGIVRVYMFEHQRHYPLLGWSSKLLPTDPVTHWADSSLRSIHRPVFEQQQLLTDPDTDQRISTSTSTSTSSTSSSNTNSNHSSAATTPLKLSPKPSGQVRWRWMDDWHVDTTPDTDLDGWLYNTDFSGHTAYQNKRKTTSHAVRRRVWSREKQPIPPGSPASPP